jgi:hypothetical protein
MGRGLMGRCRAKKLVEFLSDRKPQYYLDTQTEDRKPQASRRGHVSSASALE